MNVGKIDATLNTKELIALVGSPNAGKTTLFNWLTHSKFKTVNYPGATVDYSIADVHDEYGHNYTMMDTPGTYSLIPKSADEEVTLRALQEMHSGRKVSKVICVIDGTQLERHLLLAEQLKKSGFSFVLVVTMADLIKKNGLSFDKKVLEKHYHQPVVFFNGNNGEGLQEIIKTLAEIKPHEIINTQVLKNRDIKIETENIRKLCQLVFNNKNAHAKVYENTARLDQWLLSPVYGLFIFFLAMSLLFSSIFWLSKPLMDLIDSSFTFVGEWVYDHGAKTLLADFISHGIINSFGAIAVFIPQVFILFFGIGILESSGYLARAATLVDKPFSKIGLSGRSFVPLLSGFACAVPAIMATRNISSRRDRLITSLVIPLMTCSARLPVYALLLNFMLKDSPAWALGVCLSMLYMGSLFLGGFAAGILNKIIAKHRKSFFMMELPLYRSPKWRVLLADSFGRTKNYIFKAGPVIFTFAVFVWVGTTFPNYKAENPKEKLEASWLSQTGQKFEPILSPMGVDWRVGIGLLSAFAAREVFVSSLAVVLNVAETDDRGIRDKGLLTEMQNATLKDGKKLFTISSTLGLIVFFMIALQCMSTVSILAKELNSFKIAIVEVVSLNVIAYTLSVSLVQFLRFLGVP